jgi:predicted Zn-dependent protease
MWSWFAGTEADSLEAEQDYGRECAREFAAQFKGRVQAENQECVQVVGARLIRAVKDARRDFVFRTVPAPARNAFALPGGFVFITEALVDLCERDQDELAFFLAHEVAHILRGHAREKLTTGAFLNAITARLPGAAQMLSEVLNKGYSRDLELEADWEAVKLAKSAGFDALGAVRALSRLAGATPGDSGLADYFASHPPLLDRLRELSRRLEG